MMDGRLAGLIFLGVCATLAVMLLTGTITSTVSSLVFAAGLVIFGFLSRGFRRRGA